MIIMFKSKRIELVLFMWFGFVFHFFLLDDWTVIHFAERQIFAFYWLSYQVHISIAPLNVHFRPRKATTSVLTPWIAVFWMASGAQIVLEFGIVFAVSQFRIRKCCMCISTLSCGFVTKDLVFNLLELLIPLFCIGVFFIQSKLFGCLTLSQRITWSLLTYFIFLDYKFLFIAFWSTWFWAFFIA